VVRPLFQTGRLQSASFHLNQLLYAIHVHNNVRFEVDREDKIGVGFFSDVYKGTWRGRTVAIKVLAETTPRKLFLREIGIWKKLRHPNVLPLYGASSATGDTPWFFVSPYLKFGTLVEYLKRVEQEIRPLNLGVGVGANLASRSMGWRSLSLPGPYGQPEQSTSSRPPMDHFSQSNPARLTPPGSPKRPLGDHGSSVPREWDLFRFMHEISKGMEYLHENGILHGDLKASNVLVDQRYRCLIADFGQSEMKSEAFRISGIPPHRTFA
jgi:serine/threonine protein kinase